jgi:hypothetical protein
MMQQQPNPNQQDQNDATQEFADIDQYVPPQPQQSAQAQRSSDEPAPTPSDTATPDAGPAAPDASGTTQAPSPSAEESLEAQNIFFMLGVTDGSEEEREAFLDDLQEIVWEDFLEQDTELLLTSEEMEELQGLKSQDYDSEEAKQEALVVYLDQKIPDLEEIMLEKALELKQDIFRERIAGMREYFAENDAALERIARAEALAFEEGRWRSAAQTLNDLVEDEIDSEDTAADTAGGASDDATAAPQQ